MVSEREREKYPVVLDLEANYSVSLKNVCRLLISNKMVHCVKMTETNMDRCLWCK